MTKRIQAEVPCRDCGEILEGSLGGGRRRCLDCVMAIMRRACLEPLEPYPGPAKPWLCKCLRCGNEGRPRFGNIAGGVSNGCRDCGIAAKADRCRTEEAVAVADMRAAGFEPLGSYRNNWTPWLCECQRCGEQTSPNLHNVRSGHRCRRCVGRHSEGGFHVDEDAIVYLLVHPDYKSVKVGISNHSDRRVRQHGKCGWEPALVVDAPGTVALNAERAVLDWWRKDLGLPVHLGQQEMPQGGWTETVAAADIDLTATMELIQRFVLTG